MAMQFLSSTGKTVLPDLDWPTAPGSEPLECCRDALLGFYNVTDKTFWPKQAHAGRAPEVVRIITDRGRIVASYSVKDVMRETGRQLLDVT